MTSWVYVFCRADSSSNTQCVDTDNMYYLHRSNYPPQSQRYWEDLTDDVRNYGFKDTDLRAVYVEGTRTMSRLIDSLCYHNNLRCWQTPGGHTLLREKKNVLPVCYCKLPCVNNIVDTTSVVNTIDGRDADVGGIKNGSKDNKLSHWVCAGLVDCGFKAKRLL